MTAQFQETGTESGILLAQIPLLHLAFFMLTLIKLEAINEIYH